MRWIPIASLSSSLLVGILGTAYFVTTFYGDFSQTPNIQNEKKAQMQRVRNRLTQAAPVHPQAPSIAHVVPPAHLPEPSFTPGFVPPMRNGGWQFPFLDHGMYHVTNLWLKNLVYIHGVWEEQFVFSGTSIQNATQGVIGEFLVNTGQFKTWTLPNPVRGAVRISNVNGDRVSFSSTNTKGTLNVATGLFQNVSVR